ncbi:hypothetical protein [Chryseobacterium artocarpi]|uniref:hypothetical protein n=1 Tax=Chryseobacterium artocarpi TaxID=1414727 RepID=UPI001E5A90D0|nr:hypothetical protein [Chryseobacterium artocarpi]
MKNILCLFCCTIFLLVSCQKRNIQMFNNPAKVVKTDSVSDTPLLGEQCLTTIDHTTKCDDNNVLLKGKILKIESESFQFIASPVEFKNQILVGKPRPLSVDILDFEEFKNKMDKNHLRKMENIKITYFLKQDKSELVFRSYQLLDLKIESTYTFNAVLYKITTSDQVKRIIFIVGYK